MKEVRTDEEGRKPVTEITHEFSTDEPNVAYKDTYVEITPNGSFVDKTKDEIWVKMKNWEGFYEISNYGHIRRVSADVMFPTKTSTGNTTKGGNILRTLTINSGYETVNLCRKNPDGTLHSERRTVHREVAKNFVENPDPEHKTMVNHKNGNKHDNRAENLEWCTGSQNATHAVLTGLTVAKQGLEHDGCVMNREMVIEARRRARKGEFIESIASSMGIAPTTVSNAVSGVTFSEVTEEKPIDRGIGGFNSKLCKIQRDSVPALLERIQSGESLVDIAKDYGCHARTVRQTVRRYMQEFSNKGGNE